MLSPGRDANCFFQSFFHTLTSLPQSELDKVQEKHPASIKAFVDTFNKQLSLEPQVDFNKIMDMSRKMHPLERECVFGPILRHTYNTMISETSDTSPLLTGQLLPIDPNAIVFQPETVQFANAFGAEISAYMSEEQFDLSLKGGMPPDVAKRIGETRFEIEDKVFFRDNTPNQKIDDKCFDVNLIYADAHLNYTLGTKELNDEHRNQVITQRTNTQDGIFAIAAADKDKAPMAENNLKFDDIAKMLRERFSLTEKPEKQVEVTSDKITSSMATMFQMLKINKDNLPNFDEKEEKKLQKEAVQLQPMQESIKNPENNLEEPSTTITFHK